jgi:hypothetical protein
MNTGQTLTCSKWLPNFRTIGIVLPETQGPQSCPLRVGKPSSWRSNFVRKAIQFRTQVCVGFCAQPTYGDLYANFIWAYWVGYPVAGDLTMNKHGNFYKRIIQGRKRTETYCQPRRIFLVQYGMYMSPLLLHHLHLSPY